ncbi:MAG: hypothetical protein AAF790_15065 [Planctomycetota bacterium]
MDRSRPLPRTGAALRGTLLLAAACLAASASGCLHQLLATGIYFAEGGNMVDAETDALQGRTVVVFCRPPSASEYSHAGASRGIARHVSSLLRKNLPEATVVDPREVDKWLDENDSDDYRALGQAVGADMVLRIELDEFDLFDGPTLYQGNADARIAVYDLAEGGELVFDDQLDSFRFPVHSGIPAQDKPVRQFQNQFVKILANEIAIRFYKHNPHDTFAIDAQANR